MRSTGPKSHQCNEEAKLQAICIKLNVQCTNKKKVWCMMCNMNGKGSRSQMQRIKYEGTLLTQKHEIAS